MASLFGFSLSRTQVSLGVLYTHDLHQPERGVRCFQRSITLLQATGDTYRLPMLLANLSIAHTAVGDRAQADVCLERALSLGQQSSSIEAQSLVMNPPL